MLAFTILDGRRNDRAIFDCDNIIRKDVRPDLPGKPDALSFDRLVIINDLAQPGRIVTSVATILLHSFVKLANHGRPGHPADTQPGHSSHRTAIYSKSVDDRPVFSLCPIAAMSIFSTFLWLLKDDFFAGLTFEHAKSFLETSAYFFREN